MKGHAGGLSGLRFHYGDLQRASVDATAALEAVRVQKSLRAALALIRLQLHRAYGGTESAPCGAFLSDEYAAVVLRQFVVVRRRPRREGPHGTERAPCARRVDEGENHANDGGNENDCPEDTPHGSPISPGAVHLRAEHREDKRYHEGTEPLGTQE